MMVFLPRYDIRGGLLEDSPSEGDDQDGPRISPRISGLVSSVGVNVSNFLNGAKNKISDVGNGVRFGLLGCP